MAAGYRGTFVISWSQTEIDGLDAAPVASLEIGAAWSWRGDAIRVDGPANILRLDGAEGSDKLRKRAAKMVHRLVGAALEEDMAVARRRLELDIGRPLMDNSFVVTDGGKSYTVTLIDVGRGVQPLCMFVGEIPPRSADLWIVHHTLGKGTIAGPDPAQGGVICFTPGTRILTPEGLRDVASLQPGDMVQTKDNGAQPLKWRGSRRMSGARLFAIPKLRPVRITAGVLGIGRPDEDLLVSPEHRLLIKGAAAQDLFNEDEVLVAAKDLINGDTIRVDMKAREVTYVHILLDRHEVVWANGVETESFHPASASLDTLDAADRARLIAEYPTLEFDAHTYGGYARRTLSASEAAILGHAA